MSLKSSVPRKTMKTKSLRTNARVLLSGEIAAAEQYLTDG